jgi:hypothetical protein
MMLKMKTVDAQMAAVLHDVVEDCGVTPELLRYEGLPPAVVEAVGALTKKIINGVEEPYQEFIERPRRRFLGGAALRLAAKPTRVVLRGRMLQRPRRSSAFGSLCWPWLRVKRVSDQA